MSKTIIFSIGFFKCGSSFTYENVSQLKDVYVPVKRKNFNIFNNNEYFLTRTLDYLLSHSLADENEIKVVLNKLLKLSKSKRIIFIEIGFSRANIDLKNRLSLLISTCNSLSIKCKVLIQFRSHHKLISSRFSHDNKISKRIGVNPVPKHIDLEKYIELVPRDRNLTLNQCKYPYCLNDIRNTTLDLRCTGNCGIMKHKIYSLNTFSLGYHYSLFREKLSIRDICILPLELLISNQKKWEKILLSFLETDKELNKSFSSKKINKTSSSNIVELSLEVKEYIKNLYFQETKNVFAEKKLDMNLLTWK